MTNYTDAEYAEMAQEDRERAYLARLDAMPFPVFSLDELKSGDCDGCGHELLNGGHRPDGVCQIELTAYGFGYAEEGSLVPCRCDRSEESDFRATLDRETDHD